MATSAESSEFPDNEDDLSMEIAQAVASIVEEGRFYKDDLKSSRTKSPRASDKSLPPLPPDIKKKVVRGSKSGTSVSGSKSKTNTTTTIGASSKESTKDPLKKPTKKKIIKAKTTTSKGSLKTVKSKLPSKTETSSDINQNVVGSEQEMVVPNFDETYYNANEPIEVSHESQMVDKPVPPSVKDSNVMDMSQYLARVQNYFDHLRYERDGEPRTTVNTRLSIKHLMSTARELIKFGQPIKCLHALILGVHFTNHTPIVERFPIHFKSEVNGKEYKHVVLGIYVQGHFGALGISRDPGLQDKPPVFTRLSELINDFYRSYIESGHELIEVKMGAIITHDPHSLEKITWKLGKVSFHIASEEIESEIEKISKKLRSQMGLTCLRCIRWNPTGVDQYSTGGYQRTGLVPLRGSRSKSLGPTKPISNTSSSGIANANARSRPNAPSQVVKSKIKK